MPEVYIVSDNIVSPLGSGTAENFGQLTAGVSGIRRQVAPEFSDKPFYASLMNGTFTARLYTKFEQLLLMSISGALQNSRIDPGDPRTILIISTTKGNIQMLETQAYSPELKERISLMTSARMVGEHLGFVQTPIVVSNACISGLLAIITGTRLLQSGKYTHAVIAGADIVSKFILSGFQSFLAVSSEPCRPFDLNRDGISLGEGAGTMVLSTAREYPGRIRVLGGATGNDANHISGPSRTGKELSAVVDRAIGESGLDKTDIDFISAHGTATPYNDEMEARAIAHSGLLGVPVHSLKGYYGHTFGAAGIIESIVAVESLRRDCLIPSKGFVELGVSQPIHIIDHVSRTPLHNCLKTASGFGGCNAAVVFGKTFAP